MTFAATIGMRRPTIEVRIGELSVGSMHAIRVQSMTTTNTMDTLATIEQTIRMINAGCELVRITAPSIREAKNLQNIRDGLHERGYHTPLVADIHFTPNAAEVAARIVEKVRINPGNFADKKQFAVVEYDDASYAAELDRIRTRFVPLVRICKEYGTAMRIGTNHGSLSDRIVNRYGDNPTGMVESALEFLRIAEDEGYHNIVLSMKSSNPVVMVQAYRLLAHRLTEEHLKPYPLHLGVTEAGDGDDGRIKSAAGIGTLLEDGLGDTIRVSLTEEPEAEVPVAAALAHRHRNVFQTSLHPSLGFHRRVTTHVASIGGDNVPRLFVDVSNEKVNNYNDLSSLGHVYDSLSDKWVMRDQAAEFVYVGASPLPFMAPGGIRQVVDFPAWVNVPDKLFCVPLFTKEQYLAEGTHHSVMNVISCSAKDLTDDLMTAVGSDHTAVLLLHGNDSSWYSNVRSAFHRLEDNGVHTPVVVRYNPYAADADEFLLNASSDVGGIFIDGYGNGIMIGRHVALPLGILQATRTRMTKTEYVSCPSCGRTMFDLQETTSLIRSHTDHLKSVKIGVMGCIVNGPGEMADADYGYVGSGPERITLYKGQTIVKRNVPTAEAVTELIKIIKDDGRWIDRE
ncbi:MAG: (E)-4-hydroxy-3-methylbut-2-enyl-diphosphate synthase [Ignavibacteria bacterium]|nr:(E)-4-hydroxy-3-methylbut-2-enyl-diphosphate synthase [Ignavibacteria bacterium]